MHESYFSYSLTRSYPFKWFTPVVVIGCILATALFTFLNVATNGYNMVTIETSEPNATISSNLVYSKWPSFVSARVRSSCDSRTLSVGQSYYTNNTAISYRLDEIWQSDSSDGPTKHFGDLPYWNNKLMNCEVPHQSILFESFDRSAIRIARQAWGIALQATVICNLDIFEGPNTIQMTATYDWNPDSGGTFPGRNETAKASLWWGESLLAWYYIEITEKAGSYSTEWMPRKAYMEFRPNAASLAAKDVTPERLPETYCNRSTYGWFGIKNDGGVIYEAAENVTKLGLLPDLEAISVLFHSTVMADLGQRGPNILDDPKRLEYFASNFTREKKPDGGLNVPEGLAAGPYTSSNASKWNISINDSVFSATYLCRVPRLKSSSSLIFSLLVADLVLLQALWKVFVVVVDAYMVRTYREMRSCEACRWGKADENGSQHFETSPQSELSPMLAKHNKEL